MVDVGPTDPREAACLEQQRLAARRRRGEVLLSALEVVFLLTAVVGLGLWSVPLALAVGGAVGAAACEWTARRRAPHPVEPSRAQR